MKKLELVNGSGEVVKEYSVGNYYVTDTVIESKMMTMTRVERQADGSFVDAAEDHIVTLSTCAYEFENARFGVLCRVSARNDAQ